MYRLFVTLAVLVIVHNDMTFCHFHHPGHGPNFGYGMGLHHGFGYGMGLHHGFGHGTGQHHGFGHGPGRGPGFIYGPGHPPGFHQWPGNYPAFPSGPGFNPGFHYVSGNLPAFPPGPGYNPGFQRGPEHQPDFHHGPVRHELVASEIRRKYAEVLVILYNSCWNNLITPKIVYSTTSYVIIYNLPETKDLKVSITIQNQILATEVTGTGVFKGFSDVRVLPDILNLTEAQWMFQGSDLKILIPYKVQLGALFTIECTPRNESIIEVPNPRLTKMYPRILVI